MSDFDEEAERERLREKYERDQEKRKATEKMSDLLLKGATMTNAHCQECGDPIFRYDGREFCPTCERIVAEDVDSGGAAGDDSGATDAGEGGAGDADTAESGADATAHAGTGDGSGDAGGGGTADATPGPTGSVDGEDPHIEVKSPTGPPATTADAVEDSSAGSRGDGPAGDAPGGEPTPDPTSTSTDSGGEASLSAARESLVRTLTAQARRAEACEDPRQARDHLEAAREAAETLAALSS